ncbi:MAG TPA: PA2779 family protein [Terracidiphilus sp.]|nr:PA2779 family protein [Terracidiphilus sp.]
MKLEQKEIFRAMAVGALIPLFAMPPSMFAETPDHVVSSAELQKATVEATQARQKNVDTLNKFFSSDQAQTALKEAHMSPQEVKTAVAGLSDQELAQLASRATKAQNDFAAGTITDRDLLIILVAVAALILIIVAVR